MNTVFETYLKEAIGEDNARIALDALSGPASVSVRMNPGKVNAGVVNAGVTELNAGIVNADVAEVDTDADISANQDFTALMANFSSEICQKYPLWHGVLTEFSCRNAHVSPSIRCSTQAATTFRTRRQCSSATSSGKC